MSLSVSFSTNPTDPALPANPVDTSLIKRPLITDSYRMLSPENLPDLSTNELITLEMIANIQTLDPGSTITVKRVLDLFKISSLKQALLLSSAISSLRERQLVATNSDNSLRLNTQVRMHRPSRIRRVFAGFNKRGEAHLSQIARRRGTGNVR